MGDYPMNLNDNLESLPQLQRLYEGSHGPNGQPAHNQDHGATARAEIAKLGDQPSLTDVACMVMSSLFECKADIKSVQGVLAQSVGLNTQKIDLHDRQLNWLKQNSTNNDIRLDAALRRIDELDRDREDIKVIKEKHYKNICESRQRSVKGNFILSGSDIPRHSQGENLFAVAAQIIWDKYGITLDWYQLKAIHRMPSGGIILVTTNRLPGSMFEHFMRAVNGNPNRHIRAYLNIQLMEPFDALHYVARKMKSARVISNYRLDENGYTWIAMSEDRNSFKFTSINQLASLGVILPEGLKKDVKEYQGRRAQREKEAEDKNLAGGSQPRLNRAPPPSNNSSGGLNGGTNYSVPQQNSPNSRGAPNQTPNQTPTDQVPHRQSAPSQTGGNPTVQGPQQRLPAPTVPPPTHPPHFPVSGSAGGGTHQAQGGVLGGGTFPRGSQPSTTQRSPVNQNRRESEGMRNQPVQSDPNRLFNPLFSDTERRGYNQAEQLGIHPSATVNDWNFGI